MTRPLLSDLLRVLSRLEDQACSARDLADRGRPARLGSLIPDVLRDEDCRVLLDPGARRELAVEAPAQARRWSEWLDADLSAEAQWRSRAAHTVIEFGPKQVNLQELEREIEHSDETRREAAIEVAAKAWSGRDLAVTSWLRPRSEPATSAEPEPEAKTASGLVLPDAATIAAITGGILGEPAELAAVSEAAAAAEEAPDTAGPTASDLFGLAELARALAESIGQPLTGWAHWRRAIAGTHDDFSLGSTPKPDRPSLPWPRPGVPLRRRSSAARPAGHGARDTLAHLISGRGPAWAAAALSSSFVEAELADSGPRGIERVRGLALSWLGLALEAGWVAASGDDAQAVTASSRGVAVDGAPRWWAERSLRERWFAARPGEAESVYLRDDALWEALLVGAQSNLHLRERFDEDWFRNPRGERADPSAEPLEVTRVIEWLREQARL